MNSRRKAGLIVDHGDRFIHKNSPVIRELVIDCGLHGESQPLHKPICMAQPDGTFIEETRAEDQDAMVFADGMLVLPEALRRTLGGFYSIAVTAIEYDEVLEKFVIRTEPPLRITETQADAVVVACAAPEALRISKPIHGFMHDEFLKQLAQVQYTKCLTLIAALNATQLKENIYGLYPPQTPNALLKWIAFEDQKCLGREVEGWHSIVAHATPKASRKMWELDEDEVIKKMYGEIRNFVDELPEKWRWARIKRWAISRLMDENSILNADKFPAAKDDGLVAFCGDYRIGDGVESAALSGKEASERLAARIKKKLPDME